MPDIKKLEIMENSPYQDSGFRHVIEDHLPIIRSQFSSIQDIPPVLADRYHGSFYGLLSALDDGPITTIPSSAFWVVLRVNGFYSPIDYNQEIKKILIPDMIYVDQILQVYKMVKKT